MLTLEMMREYHMDYFTFMQQPSWIHDLMYRRMEIDAKKAKHEAAKNKHP